MNQKQRLEEAGRINARFHMWMGFMVCDGEEDMLSLRKLVKKIEREAISEGLKNLTDNDVENICQSETLKEIKQTLRETLLRGDAK